MRIGIYPSVKKKNANQGIRQDRDLLAQEWYKQGVGRIISEITNKISIGNSMTCSDIWQ